MAPPRARMTNNRSTGVGGMYLGFNWHLEIASIRLQNVFSVVTCNVKHEVIDVK